MKIIVITGSTQGIGFGLAGEFLKLGCAVVISGRSPDRVEKAAASLSARFDGQRVAGFTCDVTQFDQVQALWDAAASRFGRVDIWINNAGIANPQANFWDQSPQVLSQVVDTNLLGAMYGSVVALRGMLKQGSGALYNMEGYGSRGKNMVTGLGLYGTTKAGLRFLDEALFEEVKGKPVIVGAILPGMVATNMISSQYEGRPQDWERARRIFNIIADRVETVTPWIAKRVLENDKNGARISWISSARIFFRFLQAPFVKRNVFDQ